MSEVVAVFATLSGLALFEEARALYGDEAVNAQLGIENNTVNIWRRRHGVPPDKREQLLAMVAEKRLRGPEREALGRLTEVVRLLAGPTALGPPIDEGKAEPGRIVPTRTGPPEIKESKETAEPAPKKRRAG